MFVTLATAGLRLPRTQLNFRAPKSETLSNTVKHGLIKMTFSDPLREEKLRNPLQTSGATRLCHVQVCSLVRKQLVHIELTHWN